VTASGAHVLPDDAVRVVAVLPATFGPLPPATDALARAFAEVLIPAGLPCEVVADPWPAIWRKLIINAAINPIAALTGRPNGDLIEVPWLRRLSAAVAREVHAVALARGIDLAGDDPVALVEWACTVTATNHCSMLQDFEAGRPTEIDQLNGAVVALAPPSTPAPLCAALATLVKCAAQ
jgi:2-dehydropantoate 2-reductase